MKQILILLLLTGCGSGERVVEEPKPEPPFCKPTKVCPNSAGGKCFFVENPFCGED